MPAEIGFYREDVDAARNGPVTLAQDIPIQFAPIRIVVLQSRHKIARQSKDADRAPLRKMDELDEAIAFVPIPRAPLPAAAFQSVIPVDAVGIRDDENLSQFFRAGKREVKFCHVRCDRRFRLRGIDRIDRSNARGKRSDENRAVRKTGGRDAVPIPFSPDEV